VKWRFYNSNPANRARGLFPSCRLVQNPFVRFAAYTFFDHKLPIRAITGQLQEKLAMERTGGLLSQTDAAEQVMETLVGAQRVQLGFYLEIA
jgi:hypothetical protein